jgi:uncharacterized SAM-binding protein YcdF (DUF218 family)
MSADKKMRVRRALVKLAACIFVVLSVLYSLGFILSSTDPMPGHADAAIVLQGSIAGENARVAGAVPLLKAGTVSLIVISIPRESYWAEAPEPAARQYMEKNYGVTDHLEFCETGPEVNSTEEEAQAVSACILHQGWRSAIIVTSNYHTRRAGLIWRTTLRRQAPGIQMSVQGVNDPEWDAHAWWRTRIYAKTALLESTKLVWTVLTMWF